MFLFCIFTAMLMLAVIMLQSNSQPEKKVYKAILVPKTIDETNGFWTSLIAGSQLGAEEYGIDLQVVGGLSEEDIE